MKKVFLSLLAVIVAAATFISEPTKVKANNFSASASVSSAKPGETFNVTISGIANIRARFDITVNNGSGNTAFSVTGQSSQSFSVTAGNSGSVTIVVVVTDGATMDDVDISGQKQTITVPIKTNTSGSNGGSSSGSTGGSGGSTTQKPTDNRSKDNNLSSLSISEGTLTPEFSADVTEYSVELPSSTTSISVDATASDSKASVSGTGEVSLNAGNNDIDITVTAENGNPKVYKIHAYVDETPLIFTKYGDEELGVVRNLDNAPVLDGFEETTVILENEEVRAWHSPTRNITVVYLQKGNEKNFYIYDETKGITSIYIPVGILGHNLGIVDVPTELQERAGMTYQMITVEDMEVMGWVYNDTSFENYSLLYAMDEQGVYHYYQYESSLSSLQLYSGAAAITQSEYEKLVQDQNMKSMIMYISLGVCVVFLGGMIFGLVNMNRYKKRLLNKSDSTSSNPEE